MTPTTHETPSYGSLMKVLRSHQTELSDEREAVTTRLAEIDEQLQAINATMTLFTKHVYAETPASVAPVYKSLREHVIDILRENAPVKLGRKEISELLYARGHGIGVEKVSTLLWLLSKQGCAKSTLGNKWEYIGDKHKKRAAA